jgi:transcriptional pleiotropic regulator of transition state genes
MAAGGKLEPRSAQRSQGCGRLGPRPMGGTVGMGATTRSTRGVRTTGIIRQIDELGRIVIPIEIRKRFGLGEKDPLEISVRDEVILLSRPRSLCVFCGGSADIRQYRGRAICGTCIAELAGSEV